MRTWRWLAKYWLLLLDVVAGAFVLGCLATLPPDYSGPLLYLMLIATLIVATLWALAGGEEVD